MDSHTTPLTALGDDEVAELKRITLGPEQGCGRIRRAAARPTTSRGGVGDSWVPRALPE